jgi:hypothetical protein
VSVKPGDKRFVKIGKRLGLTPQEVFEMAVDSDAL